MISRAKDKKGFAIYKYTLLLGIGIGLFFSNANGVRLLPFADSVFPLPPFARHRLAPGSFRYDPALRPVSASVAKTLKAKKSKFADPEKALDSDFPAERLGNSLLSAAAVDTADRRLAISCCANVPSGRGPPHSFIVSF